MQGITDFLTAADSHGLMIQGDPIADGKWHYVYVCGDKKGTKMGDVCFIPMAVAGSMVLGKTVVRGTIVANCGQRRRKSTMIPQTMPYDQSIFDLDAATFLLPNKNNALRDNRVAISPATFATFTQNAPSQTVENSKVAEVAGGDLDNAPSLGAVHAFTEDCEERAAIKEYDAPDCYAGKAGATAAAYE